MHIRDGKSDEGLDILPHLQAKKLACCSTVNAKKSLDLERRKGSHKQHGPHVHVLSLYLLTSLGEWERGWSGVGHRMLHLQWVCKRPEEPQNLGNFPHLYGATDPVPSLCLRERDIFLLILDTKRQCPLLWRQTLQLSRLFTPQS